MSHQSKRQPHEVGNWQDYTHTDSKVSAIAAFIVMISNAYILGGGTLDELSVSIDSHQDGGLCLQLSFLSDTREGGLREGEYLYTAILQPVDRRKYKALTSFLKGNHISWFIMPGNAAGWNEHIDLDVPIKERLQFSTFDPEFDKGDYDA